MYFTVLSHNKWENMIIILCNYFIRELQANYFIRELQANYFIHKLFYL